MATSLDRACVIVTSRWRHDTSSYYLPCFGEVWLYNLIINSANLNKALIFWIYMPMDRN